MNTIKNLQVNKKAKCLNKGLKLKLITGIVVAAAVVSIPFAIKAHTTNIESEQKTAIVAYYGKDSVESNIIKYIDISETLNKLYLENFDIEDSLFEKHNISDKLKSPEELQEYIEKFKNINSYISSKDITKQSKNIDTVLNLVMQEKLVNSYIYNVGYSTANNNITSATKKYAAEVFGIDDPANVYFNYFMDMGSGESNTTITNKTANEYGLLSNETYNFDNKYEKKEEKYINKGVISMNQTDISSNKIPQDNEEYNKDRNNRIKEALENSINLEKQIYDYNLYNEKMAKKMN